MVPDNSNNSSSDVMQEDALLVLNSTREALNVYFSHNIPFRLCNENLSISCVDAPVCVCFCLEVVHTCVELCSCEPALNDNADKCSCEQL